MTERPLLGLLMALLLEGRFWTRVRWDFDDASYERVWRFTAVGIVLAAVLIWLDGSRHDALPVLFSWLPLLLMPMQFVQSYGMRDSVSLTIFSFMARRRYERNKRLGLIEESPHFNFGNILFAIAVVSSSVGSKATSWLFLPGMLILSGWVLISAGRGRLKVMIPLLVVLGLLAISGKILLQKAEDWFGRAGGQGRNLFDPNYANTMIGKAGVVQQSSEIAWRLNVVPGSPPPSLLRTASFNTFLGTNWQNLYIKVDDFSVLDSRIISEESYDLLNDHWNRNDPSVLPAYTLRGAVDAESPLPLPGDAAALRDFELDSVEKNSFGTVRVFPKHPVINGMAFWRGGLNSEAAPRLEDDLRLPQNERETVRAVIESLGIRPDMPLADQLALIQSFFYQKFRYTRRLTIRHSAYRLNKGTSISRFLTDTRAGHCEYFATAAALILREAGIPARYVTGYMLIERDFKRGGYVIRGTHGHAWCRVWDQKTGSWLDFDPTPPDWTASVSSPPTLTQRMSDQFRRLREDFYLWRNHPDNRLAILVIMSSISLIMGVFIVRRLWRSRQRLESQVRISGYQGPLVRTPLHELEIHARKHLGERPPGLPFARWLERLQPLIPQSAALNEAIVLHQRLRFDPAPAEPHEHQRLVQIAEELRHMLQSIHTKHRS